MVEGGLGGRLLAEISFLVPAPRLQIIYSHNPSIHHASSIAGQQNYCTRIDRCLAGWGEQVIGQEDPEDGQLEEELKCPSSWVMSSSFPDDTDELQRKNATKTVSEYFVPLPNEKEEFKSGNKTAE